MACLVWHVLCGMSWLACIVLHDVHELCLHELCLLCCFCFVTSLWFLWFFMAFLYSGNVSDQEIYLHQRPAWSFNRPSPPQTLFRLMKLISFWMLQDGHILIILVSKRFAAWWKKIWRRKSNRSLRQLIVILLQNVLSDGFINLIFQRKTVDDAVLGDARIGNYWIQWPFLLV